MSTVRSYLSLIKFSHTIFAMPFALIGFFLAIFQKNFLLVRTEQWNLNKTVGWGWDTSNFAWWKDNYLAKLILVILCMVFARSAAMAFNRYLDRSFDAKNPRTAIREIPAGIISANSALSFTVVSSFLFIVTCYFINRICFILSPVALLIVLGYSYTKRFTPLCHLVLGLGLSLAPIGAYLAVTGHFSWLPILFSLSVIFWVSGFDIIYALQDEQFDKSQNLYSIPAWLGKSKALRVSSTLHVLSAVCVVIAGLGGDFGWLYWVGVIIFCGMLIYQHSIVKPGDLKRVNLAFMTANGIASVVFACFVIADLFFN
jgi:4-hydroxybenzoate polyprenyltransferase